MLALSDADKPLAEMPVVPEAVGTTTIVLKRKLDQNDYDM
jgi:hypothetical protein